MEVGGALMKKLGILATCSFMVLAACGSSEEQEQQQQQIDFAAFDIPALEKIVSDGEPVQAIQIIRGKEQLNLATTEDFLLSTEIYITLLNGVAAEVELDKAIELGAEGEQIDLFRARVLLLQKKLDEAEDVLKEVTFTSDLAYEALLLRGDIKNELKEFEAAKGFYQAAVDDKPDNYYGYVGLAQLELNQGFIEDAFENASKANELQPNDPIVLYLLGSTSRYLLKPDEAIAYLNQALEQNEQHYLALLELVAIYIEKNEFEQARKQLDTVYALSPDDRMARYYSALLLASEGKNEEAEELMLRLGDLPKVYPPAARVYGHIAYRLGKYSTATPYLEQFLRLLPEDRPTRLALAEAYTRRGKAREALRLLKVLLDANEADLEANLQAAAAAGIMGDREKVGEYVSRAQNLAQTGTDEDKELIRSLGRRLAINTYQKGNDQGAIDQLQQMASEDEEDLLTLTLMANLQMESGDLAGAEATTSKLLTVSPDNPVGANLMGSVRYRQRKIDEALEFYNKALEANPEYVSALKNRGLVYLVQEKFVEARDDLAKVIAANPRDAQAHGMYGRALLETGDAKESLGHFQTAEEAFPRSAILHADHSEALAKLGYYATAIKQAQRAISYSGGHKELNAYLNNLIAEWTEIEKTQREEEEKAREERRAKRAEQRKEQEERLKQGRKEGEPKEEGEEDTEPAKDDPPRD